jgi:sucrose phosphorylase
MRDDLARAFAPHIASLTDDPVVAADIESRLLAVAQEHAKGLAERPVRALTERTGFLITYGDSIRRDGQAPLATLSEVLDATVGEALSDVHLLPIFPWTSDDGFAVVDYRLVDPGLGTWEDVAAVGRGRGLALDFVANHLSTSSPWFRGWLAGNPAYRNYFLCPPADFDASHVVRPRTTPLVHGYPRPDGTVASAWTTFGPDQVDVNVAEPAVFAELTDVLLEYVERGADTVRLDAIGYLWKTSGTSCIHLPQTHAVIKIWRVILDALAPGVLLLTETNVPHAQNVSYFGDLDDEAHMVYQFALPPLVLHSFVSGSSRRLSEWARGLEDLGPRATWFNFLASHDGVGLRPTAGLLTPEHREALAARAVESGGRASYADEPDGGRSVYELNVNYLDALVDGEERADPHTVVARGLAAHAIMLSMVGVPAIYVHSLFGSSGDVAGMEDSGIARRINREKLDADALLLALPTDARRGGMLGGLVHMLRVRRDHPAFSPFSPRQVLDLGDQVVAIRRGSGAGAITAIVNVSHASVELPGARGLDVLTGKIHDSLTLARDGVVWLVQGEQP